MAATARSGGILGPNRIDLVASPTQLRDKAHRLAAACSDDALQVARAIPEPWFAAQALAAVARWIDEARVLAIADESLAAAGACADDYQRAAVSAWPIRALVERGQVEAAHRALRRARTLALAATPAGSRAEALLGLLQGAWALGAPTRRQFAEDLLSLRRDSDHWRVNRALVQAVEMLAKSEPEVALEVAGRIADDGCRRKAIAAIQAGRACGPRGYF